MTHLSKEHVIARWGGGVVVVLEFRPFLRTRDTCNRVNLGTSVQEWRPSVTAFWPEIVFSNQVRPLCLGAGIAGTTGILGLNGNKPGKMGSLGKTRIEPRRLRTILASCVVRVWHRSKRLFANFGARLFRHIDTPSTPIVSSPPVVRSERFGDGLMSPIGWLHGNP